MSDGYTTAENSTKAPAGENRAAALNFPCSGCGSQMAFDPDTQELKCSHCGRLEPIPAPLMEAPEYLYDPRTDAYEAPDWDTMGGRSVQCKGCGAQTVIPAEDTTSVCPFCGSHYVVDDTGAPGIMPESLMPFKVSKEKALQQFRTWVKKRFWAPRAFKKRSHRTEELTGIYVPFWTYDAELYTTYSGEIGKDYTVTRTRVVNGKTQTYTTTHTRWYPVSGNDAVTFDDRLLCATDRLDTGMIQKLGAFSTKVLNRYSPSFLAGFAAQRYTIGVGEGWQKASQSMQRDMEDRIVSSLHGDHHRNMVYQHNFSNVRFKHILLPVWLSSYTYKEKVYRFMINGETGRLEGKAPVSVLKVLAAIGIGLAAILALYFLLYYFR